MSKLSFLVRRRVLLAVGAMPFAGAAGARSSAGMPAQTVAGAEDRRQPAPSTPDSAPERRLAEWPGHALAPQLATVYAGQVEPALCFVSEKYDGVRAVWDGETLRHRSGRRIHAPDSFLATLPTVPLDGELWLGRGRFEPLSALVRRDAPREGEWRDVRYMVFDMPVAGPSFAARLDRLAAALPSSGAAAVLAPQWRVADRAELGRTLDRIVAAGGEGLVLHVADARYAAGRSDTLLKLKPHLDAEAVVVGHRGGAGKYRGLAGAIEVESPQGRRFFIGSGLDDAARREPPPIGATVTYRYRDLTSSGLPRFATYLRRHDGD
jgi:DNA ligase-1